MSETKSKKMKWSDPVLVKIGRETGRGTCTNGSGNAVCSPSGSAATQFCITGAGADPP